MLHPRRYDRNKCTIDANQQEVLAQKTVLVVGCGGLGGFIIEGLARVGVGRIRAVDYDTFDESNLNRQLNCTVDRLGTSKVQAAADRVRAVNPDIAIEPICAKFGQDNATQLLAGVDLVVDALDSLPARLLLEAACLERGIPFVHGGIGGDYGQFGVSLPGQPLLCGLPALEGGVEKQLGNPFYTPCIVAGLQVKLAVDVLLQNPVQAGGLYYLDLDDFTIEFVPICRP